MINRIKVAEEIKEYAEELAAREASYLQTIHSLSYQSYRTNKTLWALLKKHHPEIKEGESWRLDQKTMEIYHMPDNDQNA